MNWLPFIAILSLPMISFGQGSILDNPQLIQKITLSLEYVYNLEYDHGDSCIAVIENDLGKDHPVVNIIKAIQIFWKARPLAEGTSDYDDYVRYLTETLEHAELLMEDPGLEVEAIFYSLASSSMLAELYSEDGASLKVIKQSRIAYHFLKMGFDLTDKYPDFHFTNGIYKYYREKYPELRPYYKSFLWFFPRGDKEKGIEDLKQCAKAGIFTKQMAYLYLFHIYLRYENNGNMALPYADSLYTKYPQNNRFKTIYTESLIACRLYALAEPLARELADEPRLFFSVPGFTFRGMIAEGNGEIDEANIHYLKALELVEKMEKSEAHIVSIIYAGLARIAIAENDEEEARKQYKMALKHDPYVSVSDEAKAYLD